MRVLEDEERAAVTAAGHNPDDPKVIAALDLIRWDLAMLGHLDVDES